MDPIYAIAKQRKSEKELSQTIYSHAHSVDMSCELIVEESDCTPIFNSTWLLEEVKGRNYKRIVLFISMKKESSVLWNGLEELFSKAFAYSIQFGCRVLVHIDLLFFLPILLHTPVVAADLFYQALQNQFAEEKKEVSYIIDAFSYAENIPYWIEDEYRWSCYIQFLERFAELIRGSKSHFYISMETLFDSKQSIHAPAEIINRVSLLLQKQSFGMWWTKELSDRASPFFYEILATALDYSLSYEIAIQNVFEKRGWNRPSQKIVTALLTVLKAYNLSQNGLKGLYEKREVSFQSIALYEQILVAKEEIQKSHRELSFLLDELSLYQEVLYRVFLLKSAHFRQMNFPDPKKKNYL